MVSGSRVAIVGGGLAGLSAAAALGSCDQEVTVWEARPFLGGRATSYPLNSGEEIGPTIDNCQHVLLRCCTNLTDFYRRLGVRDQIRFHREFYWIEPGGRVSVMKRGLLPAPLHFTESFARLHFLSLPDKVSLASALIAIRYEYGKRNDLEQITMLDWLREKNQSPRSIERFWRQVLVSAVNEDLDRMAAIHGLQVFYLGFLSDASAYEMGVPSVPLEKLYSKEIWSQYPNVKVIPRAPVGRVVIENGLATALKTEKGMTTADAYILTVPFERVDAIAPELALECTQFTHSPITGIHLWFDRPVTDLPNATLLNRTIQWMFNKEGGRYIQLVVSASRSLSDLPRSQVIELAVRELREFFPLTGEATLERAHVVKEIRATFSAAPGLEKRRPLSATKIPNLFLAGDWTRSGWPATMEGAVRSGYLAAEAVTEYLGHRERFVLPDVA